MNQKHFIGLNTKKSSEGVSLPEISKIILVVDEENAFESGDDTGYALEIYCPYGTKQMADDLLAQARGFVYTGYSAESVQLPPEAELGDGVVIDGIYGMLASRKFSFTPKLTENISAPLEKEVEHEYSYEGTLTKEMKRKLTLGASYYGTSITRQRGLEIKHYDSLGNPTTRVTLNSETLAFYNANGNKAFYYDSTTGEFKISSSIVVGLDEYEKKADLSTDISTYIDSAAGTAKIVSACSATYLSKTDADDTYETIFAAAQIAQSVSNVQSEISLSASYGSGTIGSNVRALLQLVSNADTSSIEIKADKINFTGVTTFVRPGDNISKLTNNAGYQTSANVTTIIGNTVTTDYIEALNIKVKAANITGALTIGQLPESVAEIGDIPTDTGDLTNEAGFQTASQVTTITKDTVNTAYVNALNITALGTVTAGIIQSSNYISGTSGLKIDLTNGNADITGKITATSGSMQNMTITGKLTFGGNSSYYINANYNDGSYYINLPGFKVNDASGAVFSGSLSAAKGTFAGELSAATGTFGTSIYPFCIGTGSDSANSPCIYSRDSSFAGSGGYGRVADNHVYIGGDGFSYYDGKSTTFDYNTAIRPGTVFCSGDSNGQQVQNTAVAYTNHGILFFYGGTTNLRNAQAFNYTIAEMSVRSGDIYMGGTFTGDSSGSIVSDVNKKHNIVQMNSKYEALFDSLKPIIYQYNNGKSGRIHTGFIAQDVLRAITDSGLTTMDFAAYVEATDLDDSIVCGLRYEEFVSLNTWQIQKLKARVAELEDIVAKLQEG